MSESFRVPPLAKSQRKRAKNTLSHGGLFVETGMFGLSDDERLERFMVRYRGTVKPVSRYKKLCERIGVARVLKDVKNMYAVFVIQQSWAEDKYVEVIDTIMKRGQFLSKKIVAVEGKKFDRRNRREARV